jgi:hypothetical protein
MAQDIVHEFPYTAGVFQPDDLQNTAKDVKVIPGTYIKLPNGSLN